MDEEYTSNPLTNHTFNNDPDSLEARPQVYVTEGFFHAMEATGFNPIAFQCDGDHQFTIVRDFNHGDTRIKDQVLTELEALAAAGVKHIILEHLNITEEQMHGMFPILQNQDVEEKRRTLNDMLEMSSQKVVHQVRELMPKSEEPIEQREIDTQFTDARMEFFLENPQSLLLQEQIIACLISLDINELLKGWYGFDPDITEETLRNASHLFESAHPSSEANKVHSGKIITELIIQSRALGIRVTPSDEYASHAMERVVSDVSEALLSFQREYDAFLQENEELEIHQSRLAEAETEEEAYAYMRSLGLDDEALTGLLERLDAYGQQTINFAARLEKLSSIQKRAQSIFDELRTGRDAEDERAQKFAEIADGEKAVVVMGGNHFQVNNPYSLGKAIDKYSVSGPSQHVSLYSSNQEYELRRDMDDQQGHPYDDSEVIFLLDENLVIFSGHKPDTRFEPSI